MSNGWGLIVVLLLLVIIFSGCSSKPLVETQIVEKLVPVPCEVKTPAECKAAYAVDRVSPRDDPLTINRAFRIEIEERWACEIKLRAALKGCNSTKLETR